ncbi:hypothetical protein AB0I28_10505 [Phytomonospora sp. NPDC050363]|uniref:hypothetical protein n=1 Tax=Phytomonospora sp. NPDC050363 TaxID=3155642 RepID=UPI0033E75E1E
MKRRPSRSATTAPVMLAALAMAGLLALSACGEEKTPALDTPSDGPSASVSAPQDPSSSTAPDPTAVPKTKEGAAARFEDYLHALGAGDLDTVCEIAGPAAEKAQEDGLGPCKSTFGVVLGMISEEQSAALRTATVDTSKLVMSPNGKVEVPVEAVVANVEFGQSDLGDYTLSYQDGNWFIVD